MMPQARFALAVCLIAAPASASTAPAWAAPTCAQADRPAEFRTARAFTVDASGAGDFVNLQTAVATVPERSLLLLKPGTYNGFTLIDHKSLRIESEVRRAAMIVGEIVVRNVGPNQEVHLSALSFQAGFQLQSCRGEVCLFDCTGAMSEEATGGHFSTNLLCGNGQSPHLVEDCDAVSMVECDLRGQDGADGTLGPSMDGTPGANGLKVVDSVVAIYGGSFVGGRGGDSYFSVHWIEGAGGDALLAEGATTHVFVTDALLRGGAPGMGYHTPCRAREMAAEDGATYSLSSGPTVRLALPPLARPGTLLSYEITAPSGADLFLKVGPRRGWRELPANVGILHLDAPYLTLPLGAMGPTGLLTETLPAPLPQWSGDFVGIEMQVHAIFNGQHRFSDPRTVTITERY